MKALTFLISFWLASTALMAHASSLVQLRPSFINQVSGNPAFQLNQETTGSDVVFSLIQASGATGDLLDADLFHLDKLGNINVVGSTAPTLSASHQAKLYFDTGTNMLMLSQNGGAYAPISGGSSGITALTGDVSASGSGSVAATVNSVGGSSAASVNTAAVAVAAATAVSTPSTLVLRDGGGATELASATIDTAITVGSNTGTNQLILQTGNGQSNPGIEIKNHSNVDVFDVFATGNLVVTPTNSSSALFVDYSSDSLVSGNGVHGIQLFGANASSIFYVDAFDGTVIAPSGVVLATSGSQPTCTSGNRGQQWIIQGGTGVADIFQICQKTEPGEVFTWVSH